MSLDGSLALLSRRENSAAQHHRSAALKANGSDALLWGSLSVAAASFASATEPALQKRQKPIATIGFPRFYQLRFQSGQATGRAPLREKSSVSIGKALAPVG